MVRGTQGTARPGAGGLPGLLGSRHHLDPTLVHLNNRDVTLICISRAPIEKLQAYQRLECVSRSRTASSTRTAPDRFLLAPYYYQLLDQIPDGRERDFPLRRHDEY